mgnify:CR=1 FL=1|tara:strand:- start:390 stop:1898 length:1509 start_codon:yes stop_codon:yes gene_type:complete
MNKIYYSRLHLPDVSQAESEIRQLFPMSDEHPIQDFGSNGSGELFTGGALDKIAVHPMILAKVRSVLKTDKIRLVQSVPWAKYGVPSSGPQSNRDQRMHMDYGNNMFGMPMPDEPLQAVAAIVYYSNYQETGGGTAIVPRLGPTDPVYQWPYVHMPGIAGYPFVNDRVLAEKIMGPAAKKIRDQCYKREVIPKFISGDVLIYRLDTWHRGTPVYPGKVRYTHNLLYKRASNTDIQNWNAGITRAMYSGKLERFIGDLDPDQLEVLGFPARDSEKWKSSKFCKAIQLRYSWTGFDLKRYIRGPPEPGPVPQFWPFTNFTFIGEDPQALRATLFDKLRAGSTQIFIKNSNWTYKLYLTDGPHYLVIDLHFFKRADGSIIAELNLLSGDRMTFGNLWNHINDKRVILRDENYWPSKTPTYVLNAIKSKAIEDSMVTMVGNDIGPEAFLPFMRSPDLNVVRIAMERFSGTKISDEITEWAQRIPRNFLEKKITERATELCEISSRL